MMGVTLVTPSRIHIGKLTNDFGVQNYRRKRIRNQRCSSDLRQRGNKHNPKPGRTIAKNIHRQKFLSLFRLNPQGQPLVTFFCKGSKLNVHPSSLSSQMSLGLKAYELTNGAEPSLKDVVSIFDYENENLTNSPELQREFFLQWMGT